MYDIHRSTKKQAENREKLSLHKIKHGAPVQKLAYTNGTEYVAVGTMGNEWTNGNRLVADHPMGCLVVARSRIRAEKSSMAIATSSACGIYSGQHHTAAKTNEYRN
jgi:hypothetical protein